MIKDAAPLHPDSSKWYWFEWDQTELNGALVTANSWTLPSGITKDDEAISGRLVGIKLSGATVDTDYDLSFKTVTDLPETLNGSVRIRCRNVGH